MFSLSQTSRRLALAMICASVSLTAHAAEWNSNTWSRGVDNQRWIFAEIQAALDGSALPGNCLGSGIDFEEGAISSFTITQNQKPVALKLLVDLRDTEVRSSVSIVNG